MNSFITPNNDAIVTEIHIAAPPERVFQALHDRAQVMQWWIGECGIENFEMDPRRGGRWIYDTKQTNTSINGVTKFHCEGEVLEYDPPRILAYTWIANWHELKSRRTVVRWELKPQSGGTLVRVTHNGLTQEDVARKDYSGGWPGVVELLRKYVEKL